MQYEQNNKAAALFFLVLIASAADHPGQSVSQCSCECSYCIRKTKIMLYINIFENKVSQYGTAFKGGQEKKNLFFLYLFIFWLGLMRIRRIKIYFEEQSLMQTTGNVCFLSFSVTLTTIR